MPGRQQQSAAADPRAGASPDSAGLVARLPGTTLLRLRVLDTAPVTPSMRRVRLTGEDLIGFDYAPGQDLMLAVPADGGTFRRRYTIRRMEDDAGLPVVDLEVVAHGDGPGARWARAAGPGDQVEAIGPRGKIPVQQDAPWHLFVGDESATPAVFAMLEAVPAGVPALARLEVEAPGAELQPPGVPADLQWVYRGPAEPGDPGPLVAAVSSVDLPPGAGRAYLFGELKVVAALRRLLLDRGLEPAQLSPKPYWRAGVANAAHGEPERD